MKKCQSKLGECANNMNDCGNLGKSCYIDLGIDEPCKCKPTYGCDNKATLREYVLAVLFDAKMKCNIAKVQELIRQAPGNLGGAEMIINYYKNI